MMGPMVIGGSPHEHIVGVQDLHMHSTSLHGDPGLMDQPPGPRRGVAQPDLSICLINHRTRDHTLDCLRSIFENTHEISLEVLVVENASNDGCAAAIRSEFPQVHLLQNRVPRSFAANNNRAIRQSTGRYVLMLNNDVLVQDSTLDTLTWFMERHPACGAATATLLRPDGSVRYRLYQTPTLRSYAYRTLVVQNLAAVSKAWSRSLSSTTGNQEPTPVENLSGACMLVRRETIDEVGLLDEGYTFYFEDADWSYRIRHAGWDLYLVPEARIVHFGDASLGQVRAWAKIEEYRSACRFFSKHGVGAGAALPVLKLLWLCNSLLRMCAYGILALTRGNRNRQNAVAYVRVLEWHLLPWRRQQLMASFGSPVPDVRESA